MSDGNMAMHMSFFWGKEVVFIFSGAGSHSSYILTLGAVFVLAVLAEIFSKEPSLQPERGRSVRAAVYALAYGLHVSLAYFVMLSIMSYNIGVLLVAVAGYTFALFLVKYKELTPVDESARLFSDSYAYFI